MGCDRGSCKRGNRMKVLDLGELSGPVLLFGGPYSNLQAFQAIVRVASHLAIPAQNVICTGDVVAYCADAETTARAVRAQPFAVIAGNCEKQIAAGAPDCGCGFDEGSACSILSHGWYAHARNQVSENTRNWMKELPDIATFTHQGKRYGVLHGGATDISRFVWETSPLSDLREEIAALENLVGQVDGIVAGHSGLPFLRDVDGKQWINTGAIGMPPNDGAPQTRYVLFDDEPAIKRLEYDYQAASSEMVRAGLTQGYDTALLTGFWPSEDTLPASQRNIQASG